MEPVIKKSIDQWSWIQTTTSWNVFYKVNVTYVFITYDSILDGTHKYEIYQEVWDIQN